MIIQIRLLYITLLLMMQAQVAMSAPIELKESSLVARGDVSFLKIDHIDLPASPGLSTVKIYVKSSGARRESPSIRVYYTQDPFELGKFECSWKKVMLEPVQGDSNMFRGIFLLPTKFSTKIKKHTRVMARDKKTFLRFQLNVKNGGGIKDRSISMEVRNLSFHLPRHLYIAILGESYAAGLGSKRYDLSDPDVEPGAYRSSLSGGELLIAELSEKFTIKKKNFSYTGAELTRDYAPSGIVVVDRERVSSRSQWGQLQEWLKASKGETDMIDYIILSIGGNDMYEDRQGVSGLSELIIDALVNRNVLNRAPGLIKTVGVVTGSPDAVVGAGAVAITKAMFSSLENDPLIIERAERGLTSFEEELRSFLSFTQSSGLGFNHTKLIMSTYPDFTRNENKEYAKPKFRNTNRSQMFNKLTKKDFKFLYERVLNPLNEIIRHECGQYLNCLLNEAEYISVRHGYSSNDPWVNRLRISDMRRADDGRMQFTPDEAGNRPGALESFHPTAEGQRKIYLNTLRGILKPGIRYKSVTPTGEMYFEKKMKVNVSSSLPNKKAFSLIKPNNVQSGKLLNKPRF
ncbi:MAG: hypothetical protein JKY80_07285 [Mariprofundaceae bacterium]|nr:hypothetical protein [Mariprofundaceae bacterium]